MSLVCQGAVVGDGRIRGEHPATLCLGGVKLGFGPWATLFRKLRTNPIVTLGGGAVCGGVKQESLSGSRSLGSESWPRRADILAVLSLLKERERERES